MHVKQAKHQVRNMLPVYLFTCYVICYILKMNTIKTEYPFLLDLFLNQYVLVFKATFMVNTFQIVWLSYKIKLI